MSPAQDIVSTETSRSVPDVQLVVCTFDRPKSLQRLLRSVFKQETTLSYQVIVVDNHPQAGLIEDLKPAFPDVQWISEAQPGISFARNTGIRAARSAVIIFADDDIEVTRDWLVSLASPVIERSFDLVVGPVSPMRLESDAERIFQAYGAHGHDAAGATFDASWLRCRRWSLPMWQVGGIGNSAVRRSVFDDIRIGPFEEALGAGTPAGSSEDLYFMYRLLRADCRVLREPAANVKHAHRRTMAGLTHQLNGYRRGEVCFCLLALIRHGDLRGLTHLALYIPSWRVRQLAEELARRLRGKQLFPLRLIVCEWMAYLSGPAALLRSLVRLWKVHHHRSTSPSQLAKDKHIHG